MPPYRGLASEGIVRRIRELDWGKQEEICRVFEEEVRQAQDREVEAEEQETAESDSEKIEGNWIDMYPPLGIAVIVRILME